MIRIQINFYPSSICFIHALSGAASGKASLSCFSPAPNSFIGIAFSESLKYGFHLLATERKNEFKWVLDQ